MIDDGELGVRRQRPAASTEARGSILARRGGKALVLGLIVLLARISAAVIWKFLSGSLFHDAEIEKERSKREYVPAIRLARIYAILGQKDQAFASLDKAYENREDGLVHINVDPRYDSLRSDPRFSNLLQRMGLTPKQSR
ncbi:MAG TPA: hypothetical protein VF088_06175 [Pyrinomonadaceae bacterium]